MFEGTATALVTPFTTDGIDFNSLDRLLDYQLNNGIDALVILGTTGEPATMSIDEKLKVIRFVVNKLKGKIPLIVGSGSNSTATAIENSIRFEDEGADALLVVTPYYNKCTQDGLIAHYTAIADNVHKPIICYNVPSRTGVNMLPCTFNKLAEHDNIVAIKEASGNMEQISECMRLIDGKAVLYCGDDALTVPSIAMGAKGVISVVSNILPKFMSTMTNYALNGDFKSSSIMQQKLLPFVKLMFSEVNPIPVKKGVSLIGYCQDIVRLPLTNMNEQNAQLLQNMIFEFL